MNKDTPGHKLIIDGEHGPMSSWVWRCECGLWVGLTPVFGAYGSSTAKAKIAKVEMAHGKHVKAVRAKFPTPTGAPNL